MAEFIAADAHVIGSADDRQVMPERTVKSQELIIRRLPVRAASLLRVHGGHLEQAAEKLSRLLGETACGSAALLGPRAFSFGGAEWLLIDYPRETVRRRLRALGRALVQVTDISSSLVSLAIEGPASRSVLGTDSDPIWTASAQISGEYASARLGEIAVVLQCTGPESFELHADRDPLDRLENWIRHRYLARRMPSHPRYQ